MANNCWNSIYIEGSEIEIESFRSELQQGYGTLLGIFNEGNIGENARWFEMDVEIEHEWISITGDSAWHPSLDLFTEISKKYPSFEIKYSYEEPGCNFAGWADISNGTLHDNCFGYWEGIVERDGEEEAYSMITEFEIDCFESEDELRESDMYNVLTDNLLKHQVIEAFNENREYLF